MWVPMPPRAKAGSGCAGRQCPLVGTGWSTKLALLCVVETWAEISVLRTEWGAGRREPRIGELMSFSHPRLSEIIGGNDIRQGCGENVEKLDLLL